MVVPPPMKSHSAKSDVRHMLKNRRDTHVSSLTIEQRDAAALLCSSVVAQAFDNAEIVAVYLPIGTEMGTAPIIDALDGLGIQIALPHVTSRTSKLRFLAWRPGQTLAAGPFGLRQPVDQAAALIPDVILTPLLGFDRNGNRIGYGAGHYDRAFAHYPQARRVGIGWSFQQVPQIPVDTWDMPLHAIATEREWIAI
jgi:5-formyltetrahydrofolate cyclo-ligase